MLFFRSKFSYDFALKNYLKDFNISVGTEEEKEIRKKIGEIISRNPEAKTESEQLVVVLAATSVKIGKKEKSKEDLINEGRVWLCFLSQTVAALYLFKDIRAISHVGAKEVFEDRLKKYCF